MLKITDIKDAPEAATSDGAKKNKSDTAYTETENKSMIFGISLRIKNL